MTPEPPIPWGTTAHAEHVAAAESRATEWVWACDANWEHLEPFWDQRDGRDPNPTRLQDAPDRKADAQLYGFDAAGELVVSREFGDGFGNDDVIKHEWLRLGAHQFEYATGGARGNYRHRLTEQRLATYDAGRMVALDRWTYMPYDDAYFHGQETYAYDATGRLVGIGAKLRLTYTEDGELDTIAGPSGWVYRRALPGTVDRARETLQRELPGRIAAWARRVTPDEAVAFVALTYGETFERVLPLMLVLATRSEVAAGGTWYPGEYERFDDDPEELHGLDDAAEVVNQHWRTTRDEDGARAFVRAVAEAVPGLAFPVIALGPNLDDLDLDVDPELQREILGQR